MEFPNYIFIDYLKHFYNFFKFEYLNGIKSHKFTLITENLSGFTLNWAIFAIIVSSKFRNL